MSLLYSPQAGQHVAVALINTYTDKGVSERYICVPIDSVEGFDTSDATWLVRVKEESVEARYPTEGDIRMTRVKVKVKGKARNDGPWLLIPSKEDEK